MIQLILLAADTIAIFVLIHIVDSLLDKQSEYADEQYKQGWRINNLENDKYELKGRINQLEWEDEQYKQSWRIQSLENDKYELKGRINALEWEVKEKNADNDNACD